MNNIFNNEEKHVLFFWVILTIIIIVILSFFGIKKYSDKTVENINGYVKDYDRFYTVNSAINKYYSFVNAKKYDSVLNILNEDYKKNNNIDFKNINDVIEFEDFDKSFESVYMCQKGLKKGVVKYYVYGNEIKTNAGTYIKDMYYQVILNGNEFIYDISIIDKSIYEGVCNEK